jgi:hypothetical protein
VASPSTIQRQNGSKIPALLMRWGNLLDEIAVTGDFLPVENCSPA